MKIHFFYMKIHFSETEGVVSLKKTEKTTMVRWEGTEIGKNNTLAKHVFCHAIRLDGKIASGIVDHLCFKKHR